MKQYHLLPDMITFRYNGRQYLARPAIVGAVGNMAIMYVGFEISVIVSPRLKTVEEIDEAIKHFIEKNKANLQGQYFYLPTPEISEEKIQRGIPASFEISQ